MIDENNPILDKLKLWCREHNVVIRHTFDDGIVIAEKTEINHATGEFEEGEIYDTNLCYIDGHVFIHQYIVREG